VVEWVFKQKQILRFAQDDKPSYGCQAFYRALTEQIPYAI